MRLRLLVTLFLTVFNVECACATSLSDVSQTIISRPDFTKMVQTTPLNSPAQVDLISRAYASGLAQLAFDQYSLLAERNPGNGNAILLKGIATESYWRYATSKSVNELPDGSSQEIALLKNAGVALAKAASLMPKSVLANVEYGQYLWQFQSDKTGISYLQKAVSLAPQNSLPHAALGEMYSNPAPALYKPTKAEAEFHAAIGLNPRYAFPHFGLARLYLDQYRFREAQTQLKAYAALLPPNSQQVSNIQFLQGMINIGLSRHR